MIEIDNIVILEIKKELKKFDKRKKHSIEEIFKKPLSRLFPELSSIDRWWIAENLILEIGSHPKVLSNEDFYELQKILELCHSEKIKNQIEIKWRLLQWY